MNTNNLQCKARVVTVKPRSGDTTLNSVAEKFPQLDLIIGEWKTPQLGRDEIAPITRRVAFHRRVGEEWGQLHSDLCRWRWEGIG